MRQLEQSELYQIEGGLVPIIISIGVGYAFYKVMKEKKFKIIYLGKW